MGVEPIQVNYNNPLHPSSEIIDRSKIRPTYIYNRSKIGNSRIILPLGIVLLILSMSIYIYQYNIFKNRFEKKWERIELLDNAYYKLVFNVHDGQIQYDFKSWLINEPICEYEYYIIAPGKVIIEYDNKRKLISVKFKNDEMVFSPAITSSDKNEHWY